MQTNTIYTGDCLDILPTLPAESVDLIMTSPPYADQRKKTYGGVKPEDYVAWFMPISEQLRRVLKPEGSFILNIKEKTQNGEKVTYVLELILALKRSGWLWREDYIWHKTTAIPGNWPDRFKDSWEHCLHFSRQLPIKIHKEAVMIDPAESTVKRGLRTNKDDKSIEYSATGSKVSVNRYRANNRDKVYPSNVLTLPPVHTNVGHSAAYPVDLPAWFIRLLTDENDIVLDPFMGSGSTAIAAKNLNRRWIGIEKLPEYVTVAEARIAGATPTKKAKDLPVDKNDFISIQMELFPTI